MNDPLQCNKCMSRFATVHSRERHEKKLIKCDKKMDCEKCKKKFKKYSNYKRHIERKTPCEPIAGDPTKDTPPDTCHFCYRKFAHKQSLNNHYNTCKIKNGGMQMLFKKIEALENTNSKLVKDMAEIKLLKENPVKKKNDVPTISIAGNNNQVDASHHNTNITLNLVCQGSKQHDEIMGAILQEMLPRVLQQPMLPGVSRERQIRDRIQSLVTGIYRNPEYKQLQNIYVADEREEKANAFTYEGDDDDVNCKKWKIGDWSMLRQEISQNIFFYAENNKDVKDKKDVLEVLKHLFVLGGNDWRDFVPLSEENVRELWTDVGKQLKYDTIIE